MEKKTALLFEDDFSSYPAGELLDTAYFRNLRRESFSGRETPVAVARDRRLGPWEQTTLHYMWQSSRIPSWRECALPWRLVDREGTRWLEQPEEFFNVVFKAGDPGWRDYVMECNVAVCGGPAGPVVRHLTSRQNYWVCFEAGKPLKLVRRDQDEHVVLARGEGLVEADRVYLFRVSCTGSRITVLTEAGEISAEDNFYGAGCIALRTEGPCRFSNVKVTASKEEVSLLHTRKKSGEARISAKKRSYPAARLIHSVAIPETASTVHIQDVNDDGIPEIIVSELCVPELDFIRLARMSVLDWEGKPLWSIGESMEGKYAPHGAFAFNAADIDGDGRTEILVTRDFNIVVIDGATGRIKNTTPTPMSFLGQEDNYERMVGDSFLVCNLRGLDSARDFILKDRYRNMWAYTSDLKMLWHRHLNTGHYPRAFDVNGDGKDEVMAGYSLLSADGSTMWVVRGCDPLYNRFPGSEHADSILVGKLGGMEDSPVEIAMAASDEGFILLDAEGNIKAQRRVGHAQNLSAGKFRPGLPGRQFAVRNAWGNYDIISLFDSGGRLLLTREIPGSGIAPVSWTGDGRTMLLFNEGLADGNFDVMVDIPLRSGRVTPASWDVNKDGVDEIFVRKENVLEVYGPDTIPANPEPAEPLGMANWNAYGGFMR